MTFAPIAFQDSVGFFSRLASWPWIDQVGLGLVMLFTLLGIWRGLWWQVIRLLGVCMAVALARTVTPNVQPIIADAMDLTPSVSYGLVWFVVFLAGLIVATILGLMGKKALEAMQLGLMDRAGGAVVGAMTGLILHAAFLVLISSLGTTTWTTRTLVDSKSASLLDRVERKWHIVMDAQAAEKTMEGWGKRWDTSSNSGTND